MCSQEDRGGEVDHPIYWMVCGTERTEMQKPSKTLAVLPGSGAGGFDRVSSETWVFP